MLTIRKHASFVPGPRICYSLLFSASQKVCVMNLQNITKEVYELSSKSKVLAISLSMLNIAKSVNLSSNNKF